MNKCLYCGNAINPSNTDQQFCNPIHGKKYELHLRNKSYKECPVIKNKDFITEHEHELMQKYVSKLSKKQIKEKMPISGGKL